MFGLAAMLAQAEPSGLVVWVDRLARAPLSQVVIVAAMVTLVRLAFWPILKDTPPDDRFGLYSFAKIVNETCDAVVFAGVVIFMLVRPFGIQTFYIPTGSMIDTLMINDYILANKLAYRIGKPSRGDIVVFKPPHRALNPGQDDTDFIKRLIGVAGDVIEWKEKKLYRNGQFVPEPYVDYTFPGNYEGSIVPNEQLAMIRQANFKLIKDGGRYIPIQYTDCFVNTMPIANTSDDQSITQCAEEFVPKSPEEAKRWKDLPAEPIPPGACFFMGDNRNGSSDGRSWGLASSDDIIGKAEFIWFPLSRWHRTN